MWAVKPKDKFTAESTSAELVRSTLLVPVILHIVTRDNYKELARKAQKELAFFGVRDGNVVAYGSCLVTKLTVERGMRWRLDRELPV